VNAAHFDILRQHLSHYIVGQQALIDSMLIALLCDGHILIEGMPGLAKTTAIKSLASGIEGDFATGGFSRDGYLQA